MKEQLFLIGIGGTGMRIVESFVHTCAMGLYDNTEINILALDTDLENGNYNRLKELVEDAYLKIKGYNKNHYTLANTLFSAKINFFKFTPDYSDAVKNGSFSAITNYAYADEKEKDLAKLLLTENIREFDLKHGYRAQTHLGSMLMYHAILNEVKQNSQGELAQFIQNIYDASETTTTKVFVVGSVFGGTGASSIPVIPKAFNAAVNVLNPGKSLAKAYFGATLLSAYFKFTAPDDSLRSKQRVVASSKNFALNSQVAMMFYNEDKTVKTTYQKFYMLGTPSNDFETKTESGETITGGAKQKNDSHYVELIAAFAAYNFFNTEPNQLEHIKQEKKEVQYYYRAIRNDGRIEYKDFISPKKVKEFAKKFGILTAMSFLTYPEHTDFFASAQAGILEKNNITGYNDIDPQEVAGIKKYFALYHFSTDGEGNIKDGWLRQLHRSTNGQDRFLFHAELFGIGNMRELKKFDFNKKLYRPDEEDVDNYTFSTGLFGSPFNSFKDEFVKLNDDESITNKSEKLVKRMYQTLEALYGFPK